MRRLLALRLFLRTAQFFALCNVALIVYGASSPAIPLFRGSFQVEGKTYPYVMAGGDPRTGGKTIVETVVLPLALTFEATSITTKLSSSELQQITQSPLFEAYDFPNGKTQYADAILHATFDRAAKSDWHVLLGKPRVAPELAMRVPAANGYFLSSRGSGKSLAIADMDFVQQQILKAIPTLSAGPGKLLVVVSKNVAYYSLGDATVCCSVGAHGMAPLNPSSKATQPFVIASYMDSGAMPRYQDIQPISQQIAEWFYDPLHGVESNQVPGWLQPPSDYRCGGRELSSAYLYEQPVDSPPLASATRASLHGREYHLQNVALLPWFAQSTSPKTFRRAYSFPDANVLAKPAQPCSARSKSQKIGSPLPQRPLSNGHQLIGYWEGYSSVRSPTPLGGVSPQWDVVIATFAAPVKGSTSLLHFEPPAAIGDEQFKKDVALLKSRGKKVLISIGGGGQVVTLNNRQDVDNFVRTMTEIVQNYQFDGIDLDIETPSLLIDANDKDFRNPTTPSVVNLIDAVRQLRRHFGPKFMLAEVPEAAQAQAGMQSYGGQFGSFLPVIYATRDILSFVDAQDYNTPPLEGLDENYYFPGTADYHVALAEMFLRGFPVGGDRTKMFLPLPAAKVAIGFLATPSSARNYTNVPAIVDSLRYLITGQPFAGAGYRLRQQTGYSGFKGAMFWAINEDARNGFEASNAVGDFLHKLPVKH
jgi:chitinase